MGARAYWQDIYKWCLHRFNLGDYNDTAPFDYEEMKKCAIFVVHGIGQQEYADTAVALRSGIEDCLHKLEPKLSVASAAPVPSDQKGTWDPEAAAFPRSAPPPMIIDGYWANYDDFEATFSSECKNFSDGEKEFFNKLWRARLKTPFRTVLWFFRQQWRLLWLSITDIRLRHGFFMYLALLVVGTAALTYMYIMDRSLIKGFIRTILKDVLPKEDATRKTTPQAEPQHSDIINGFLRDVRMYVRPEGLIQKTIVQRIDYRVGAQLLRMMGLDWDFRPIDHDKNKLKLGHKFIEFDRIIWVSHSLGTVISYNVMSDLLRRAQLIEENVVKEHDPDRQLDGVELFYKSIRRFVTLGSPLDKIAFLFPDALRAWPEDWDSTIPSGKATEESDGEISKFWVNFYHPMDPVSGSLEAIDNMAGDATKTDRIKNYTLGGLFRVPGLAHVAYWTDSPLVQWLISRCYGGGGETGMDYVKWSRQEVAFKSVSGPRPWLIWTIILVGLVYLIIANWRTFYEMLAGALSVN